MELIDLEDDTIDAEVLNSLAVTMENFRVCIAFFFHLIYTVAFALMRHTYQVFLGACGHFSTIFQFSCPRSPQFLIICRFIFIWQYTLTKIKNLGSEKRYKGYVFTLRSTSA